MRSRDLAEPIGRDLLDDDAAAARFELIHPAMRLKAHVDCLEWRFEPAGQSDQRIVQRGTERKKNAFALRGRVVPEIQPELALVRKRQIEARRGAGGAAFVQPLLRRAIGIEIDLISGAKK